MPNWGSAATRNRLAGIVGRHRGGQAGHRVADLGCIENVQTFDGEWNAPLGKFLNQFVAMVVLAIEHGKIAPAAALVLILIFVVISLRFFWMRRARSAASTSLSLQVTISTSGAAVVCPCCFASSSRSDSRGARW